MAGGRPLRCQWMRYRFACATISLRYPEEERASLEEWYGNLADMMRAEGVTEKGHLQINRMWFKT